VVDHCYVGIGLAEQVNQRGYDVGSGRAGGGDPYLAFLHQPGLQQVFRRRLPGIHHLPGIGQENLSLSGQLHTPAAAFEQAAFQGCFQSLDAHGDRCLGTEQAFCRFCEILMLLHLQKTLQGFQIHVCFLQSINIINCILAETEEKV
jgi:hypothetical protein